ncbi:MAG: PadR family transcriptional regulator [Candidatus Heimdallarchaeota archaeon]
MDNIHHEPCKEIRMPHSIPRGLLRFLILRLLQSHEMTGTKIMQTLSDRSNGVWKPSPGSIYPMLAALEEEGLIETVRKEGRSKIYCLSEDGLAHLKEIHNRKGDLEHKARLGRMLWLQLLDPIDQIHFHIIAFNTSVNILNKLAKSLSSTERENLRIHIEEIVEKLSELTNILT